MRPQKSSNTFWSRSSTGMSAKDAAVNAVVGRSATVQPTNNRLDPYRADLMGALGVPPGWLGERGQDTVSGCTESPSPASSRRTFARKMDPQFPLPPSRPVAR